jgi:predicted alpha/beta hydrolase family esterase
MNKRVFLVHGWEGSPDKGWRPWLKAELEKRGYKVVALSMPNPVNPTRNTWIAHLVKKIGEVSGSDYFVGHSLGCITILRYLESLRNNQKVGGVVLVAGFGHDLEYPDYKGELSSFFDTPINWEKIKMGGRKFIAIHSDNDPWVPLKHNDLFKEKLGAEGIIEQGKIHYGDDDGILESQTILNALLKIAA